MRFFGRINDGDEVGLRVLFQHIRPCLPPEAKAHDDELHTNLFRNRAAGSSRRFRGSQNFYPKKPALLSASPSWRLPSVRTISPCPTMMRSKSHCIRARTDRPKAVLSLIAIRNG